MQYVVHNKYVMFIIISFTPVLIRYSLSVHCANDRAVDTMDIFSAPMELIHNIKEKFKDMKFL